MHKEIFDLVYDAHRSLRSIWIVWNLTRFGFSKTPKTWLISKRNWQRSLLINLKLNFLSNTPSQRQHLLLPLQNQTSLVLNNHTELFPVPDTIMQIKNFLYKNNLMQKRYVAIGASASYPLKRWPLRYFQELISKLCRKLRIFWNEIPWMSASDNDCLLPDRWFFRWKENSVLFTFIVQIWILLNISWICLNKVQCKLHENLIYL